MMIFTEHEVKACLVYVLTPILQKYSIEIKEAHLAIHDPSISSYHPYIICFNYNVMTGYVS